MATSQREDTSRTGLGVRAGLLAFGIAFVVHTLALVIAGWSVVVNAIGVARDGGSLHDVVRQSCVS